MPHGELKLRATLRAAAGKLKRLAIVAYTGGIIDPPGWGPTVLDLAGLELPSTIPILADHENRLDAVVGTGRPSKTASLLSIAVDLVDSPAAERVVALLRSGFAAQASVGVRPLKARFIDASETTIVANGREHQVPPSGVTLVAAGRLYETSVLPLGADSQTTVRIAARRAASKGRTIVDFHDFIKTHGFDPTNLSTQQREGLLKLYQAAHGVDVDGAVLTAAADGSGDTLPELRARARDSRAARLLRERPRDAGKIRELHAVASREDWTAERLELECLYASRHTVDNQPRASRQSIAAGLGPVPVLSAALALHIGQRDIAAKYGEQVATAAERLGVRTLLDLCEQSLTLQGRHVPHGGKHELIRAAVSTGDIGNIVADVANKVALMEFERAAPTWPIIAKPVPVTDFKPSNFVRVDWLGQLEDLAPGGEIKHGTISDAQIQVTAATKALLFGLLREDLINDDAGVLVTVSEALGRMGALAISKAVYTLLLGNGGSFFGSGNSNFFDGAGSALSVDSLGLAVKTMRLQASANGEPLDLLPKTLLVPPELEATARQILNSTLIARDTSGGDQLPQGNPVPQLTLAVESRLSAAAYSGNSTTAWYVFSAAGNGAVLVAFLNGKQSPTVESAPPPFDQLGVQVRGYHDFGVALGSPAAAVKAAGA